MKEPITVFVRNGCSGCHEFTDALVKAGILFKPRVIDNDEDAISDLMMLAGDVTDFPQVLYEGELYSPEEFWAKRKEKGDGDTG